MTKTRDLSDFLIEGGADLPLGKPHIVPGVLYPSYVASGTSNKLLDGATDHSGAFGTEQSDGRKYYYTNIKGSKPIKDPRIGAYFGSQRHMFKSIQKLEHETAPHGYDVYSIDGREWMRGVGALNYVNDSHGIQVQLEGVTTSFFEITGYFNAFNFINFTSDSARNLKVELDGVTAHATFNPNGSCNSPIGSRYVTAGSVINVDLTASGSSLSSDTTLGIHTIRISWVSGTNYPQGCELIAQDTSSTANRSKIQIPAQNVVSFGKKFPISATADHFDPFSAKTDGSAWTSPTSGNNTANSAASWPTNIDTANSLGLENWVNGSSYYRPYNGGRVVKYVDSTGTIKTAVTVMPPNARSCGNANNLTNGAEKGDDSAGNTSAAAPNDNFRPTFTDQTIATADELYEVAKTFHWREFGNGAANTAGGDGKGGNADETYADASMLNASDDIAFVMEDGLTSLSANDVNVSMGGTNNIYNRLLPVGDGDFYHITFIGTGINWDQHNVNQSPFEVAQNLHYGTHVIKVYRDANDSADVTIDGVAISDVANSNYGLIRDFINIYQPKKPPIPEDAVVLADYMLMADFVGVTGSSGGIEVISKGVRAVDISSDIFWNEDTNDSYGFTWVNTSARGGHYASMTSGNISSGEASGQLPYFGTSVDVLIVDDRLSTLTEYINSTSVTKTDVSTSSWSGRSRASGQTLGLNGIKANKTSGNFTVQGFEIATPIHTSHHYQTFENPLLHDLVGGDRNMEQTNLVCSPDGKTWDEITRDTSYIGNAVLLTTTNTASTNAATTQVFDEWRGVVGGSVKYGFNKDFAIAYDRIICLKDGQYNIEAQTIKSAAVASCKIVINGAIAVMGHGSGSDYDTPNATFNANLKRGDYIQCQGAWYASSNHSYFQIKRI